MERIKIWDNNIPLFDENIKNEENKFAGTITPFLINDNEAKKRSCIIICEGGSYARHSYTCEEEAKWFNSLGINCFIVNYRVYPYKHPVPLIDVKRAIRYVRYNAEKFNINPEKIGIVGFSAGGHLAGSACLFFDKFEQNIIDEIDKVSAKPNLAILNYPVVSMCENFRHENSAKNLCGEEQELFEKLSLEKNVRKDIPKMMIWHTLEDSIVSSKNSISFITELEKKGAQFEFHLVRKGEHGLKIFEDNKDAKKILYLIKQFLEDEEYTI